MPDEPVWSPQGGGAVASVFGRTGAVVAAGGDYAARQVLGSESALGVPVCTNSNPPGQSNNLQDGVDIGGTSRIVCTTLRTVYGARLVFAGFNATNPNDFNGMQPMTIAASIEDNSGNIYPVTFNGQHYGTVAKDGLLISDIVGVDFPAGTKLWLRTLFALPNTTQSGGAVLPVATLAVASTAAGVTAAGVPYPAFDPNGGQVTVASTNGLQTLAYTGVTATSLTGVTGGTGTITAGAVVTAKIPTPAFTSLAGEACNYSATAPVDQTLGGAVASAGSSGNNAVAPLCVLSGGPRQPAVLLVGDSQFTGLQDSGSRNQGFGRRALIPGVATGGYPDTTASPTNLGIGHALVALSQDKAQTFASVLNRWRRMKLAQFCTHAVVNYGTNDLNAGRTLAQLQADLITIWTLLAARNLLVYQTTITPRTTSTDSWATTANQTPVAGTGAGSFRTQLNDWLRAGAPMQNGAAVAVGTSGALLAGAAGHPLAGFFEVADQVESARNSGLWAVNGTANWMTADGVHPSSAVGYPAAAGGITSATFT